MDKFTNIPDTTAEYSPEDMQSNKVMAILAYISWLVLIPLFAASSSPYARYHTNQGFLVVLLSTIWNIASSLITAVTAFIPVVGPIIGVLCGIIGFVVGLFCLACMILGIINAANGRAKELPIIGGIRLIK